MKWTSWPEPSANLATPLYPQRAAGRFYQVNPVSRENPRIYADFGGGWQKLPARSSLDFVAIPAILMFASLIGARCAIQPHEKDDWTVVPNLWGGILGDPGTLKSPVCGEVLLPLGYLEAKAMEDFNDKKTKYEVENTAFLEAKGVLERKIKDVMKQEGLKIESDVASIKEELSTHLKNSPSEPFLKRYKVSDTTVEKMQEILAQNPGGVLVFRDELMGFLESWEKKGHESDRSFYLEAWNGNNSFKMDRIGRGAVHAENICVSILGTTQPDKSKRTSK